MKKGTHFQESILILSKEQKEGFNAYIPKKVYRTERNISILVAMTQLFMIVLFLINKNVSWENTRALAYFCLYVFLFSVTSVALFLYRYMVKHEKYRAFVWLRRVYAFVLCFWVMGITILEQLNGNGLSVYCYLIPTTAALLLLNPIESLIVFGTSWMVLAYVLVMISNQRHVFGDMVNSIFVTVLALFISYRYYRSMAIEFHDRETIATQYDEIQRANELLKQLVHKDQLTGLYNRHYLTETMYEKFLTCREKNFYAMFLMVDIDYFKQYNDTYGHIQGDECLKSIARVIKTFGKEFDVSAVRYGGEEFLLMKISEQPFEPYILAKQFEKGIKDANIVRNDVEEERVTVSGGVWYDNLRNIEHIELAIKYADTALYEAKSTGRNRIICE